MPWALPRELTLSFAPDQTQVTTGKSSLFQVLDAQYPTAVWQGEILKAAHTWASIANIDIGFVSDAGLSFGTNSGTGTNRTSGDIRIGAVPMPATSLAIGLPPDPFFGDYWSGDILYNATNSLNPAQTDLYSVFLHELGHTLGLASSTDSASVMYDSAVAPVAGLSPADVAAIQSLYGARQQDSHDVLLNNGTIEDATSIDPGHNSGGNSFTGDFPLVDFGDLTTATDVDYYEIRNVKTYSGPITFTVQSRGVSLLSPKMSIYDSNNDLVGSSLSTEAGGGTISVVINSTVPNAHYRIKVESAPGTSFATGRYAVAATFNSLANPVYLARLNAVMTGPFDQLNADDTAELFLDPTHAEFNDDSGGNDVVANATALSGPAAYTSYVGAIESATDIDTYKIHTP